jgi:ribosomal-protein-alanine N-acetyltransferase
VALSATSLELSLAGNRSALAERLGFEVPPAWWTDLPLLRMRLADLRHDPLYAPWSLRAIVAREALEMVGHFGFHTRPGPAYLRDLAPGGVELGYTVYPPHRGQGFAKEACAAAMAWARREHAIDRFVLSIAPDNAASIAIAVSFGFQRVGSHLDPVDGPEDIWVSS